MKNDTFEQPMLMMAVIINTVIFIFLAILHFYWASGGKCWYDSVLPTSSNGLNKLHPGTAATLIVAFGLLLFAFTTVSSVGLFDRYIQRKYFRFGLLAIAILFFVRAVGDFKFMGFFKTIKHTRFGINDTQIFSPLCLFISLLSLLIFICSRNKPVP